MPDLYGVSTSSVQRAVGAITLGTVKAYDDRKVEDWKGGMDEYDQQFRIPFQALVNYKTRWVTTLLQFDVSFVEETSRDSPYTFTPHFTWGWQFVKTRDNLAGPAGLESEPVMITCCVTAYGYNEDGSACESVEVSIGMVNPGIKQNVLAAGIVFLNFQGYAVPRTDDLLKENAE